MTRSKEHFIIAVEFSTLAKAVRTVRGMETSSALSSAHWKEPNEFWRSRQEAEFFNCCLGVRAWWKSRRGLFGAHMPTRAHRIWGWGPAPCVV